MNSVHNLNALTLLVGWQKGHLACKNFCVKTSWNTVTAVKVPCGYETFWPVMRMLMIRTT